MVANPFENAAQLRHPTYDLKNAPSRVAPIF